MKTIFFVAMATLISFSANATTVLVEQVTHVGFAPADMRGTYRFQVLSSGVVQKIDNKNKVSEVAKLSKDVLAKLTSGISLIKEVKLVDPNTPMCMDAPSQSVVITLKGQPTAIYKKIGCVAHTSEDSVTAQVATIVNDLQSTFSQIDYLTHLSN